MKNIRIKIKNTEHSTTIQWLLFELGCSWPNRVYIVHHTDKLFLYVDARRIISYGDSSEIYHEHNYREVRRKELETELKNRREVELLDLDTKPKLEGASEHAPLTSTKSYDEKGNATHYAQDRINSIEAMERIFGTQAVLHFCEINAFKYRSRLGRKKGESIKENLTKTEWYENAVKFYLNKLRSGTPIATDTKTYGLPWDSQNNEPVGMIADPDLETEAGLRQYLGAKFPSHIIDISLIWGALSTKYKLVKK